MAEIVTPSHNKINTDKRLEKINKRLAVFVVFVLHSLRAQHRAFVRSSVWLTLKIGHKVPFVLDVASELKGMKTEVIHFRRRNSSSLVICNFPHSIN